MQTEKAKKDTTDKTESSSKKGSAAVMDLKTYCGKDVAYFRNRPRPAYLADLEQRKFNQITADQAAEGFVNDVQFPDGQINFLFNPTKEKPPHNPEWLFGLNRMGFWVDMSLAYLKTGDEKYAVAFDRQINSWLTSAEHAVRGNCADSPWRTIECGIRLMGSWQIAFEVFRKAPSVSDATLEKMIFSMIEQAEYAYQNRTSKNWLTIEMCGCCTQAALFPELPNSAELWQKAKACLEKEVSSQMLPDGMQNELTPDYQNVVFLCGYKLYSLAKRAGLCQTLSAEFMKSLEGYADSAMALMTPRFTQPRTNDCYTVPTASILSPASEMFPVRKDFLWCATAGKSGTKPSGSSRNLPYSGFTAMRSGWDADATYLCFDHGPLGFNYHHQHQDKLNFQLYKGEQELIFDDGGGTYDRSVHRIYAISAYDHNTVLVDGKAQFRSTPKVADVPDRADFVSNDRFDYAKGVYDQEFAPFEKYWNNQIPGEFLARHQREILFVRPNYFCVVDTLSSKDGKPHDYTMLLHMDTLDVHPEPAFPGAYRAKYGKKYDLLIVPLQKPDLSEVHSKRLTPYPFVPCPAGWYVGRNKENLHPASTLNFVLKGRTDAFSAMLLIPIQPKDALPTITVMDSKHVDVKFQGQNHVIQLRPLSLQD